MAAVTAATAAATAFVGASPALSVETRGSRAAHGIKHRASQPAVQVGAVRPAAGTGSASNAAAAGALVAAVALGRRRGRNLRRATARAAAGDARKRVVITGLGIVSPFGTDKDEVYERLCNGESAIKKITKFDAEGLTTQIAAEITDFSGQPYLDKKSERRMDDVVKYTIVSGKKALEDAGLGSDSEAFEKLDKERCGILIGSAMGGSALQTSMDNMDKLLKGKKASPFFVPYTLVNVPGGLLAIDVGFQGPNYAVITACATGNYCISAAADHIAKGEVDVALAGGAEAAVTRAGIGGFIACKALSSRNDEPEKASRPWDKNRDGFVMGEGAGVLCLESLEHAQARGAEIYAEYLGSAYTCDAHHMTEPQPQGKGVSRCIKMALENSGIGPEDVGYVNCHGTSTPAGDFAEVAAIVKGMDGKTDHMIVNSTKSMLGHCLGAAAGVEAVICVQALRKQKVHPTLNQDDLDERMVLKTSSEAVELPDLKIAANNSFGFGGHNSCVIFKRWEE